MSSCPLVSAESTHFFSKLWAAFACAFPSVCIAHRASVLQKPVGLTDLAGNDLAGEGWIIFWPPLHENKVRQMLEQSTAKHGTTAAACRDTASSWLCSPWAEAGTGAPSFSSLDHRLGSPFWTYHQVCCTAGPAPNKAFSAETVPRRIMETQPQPRWLNALNNWNTLRSRYFHPVLICSWDLGQFLFLKLWSHFNIFSHRTTARVLAPVIWSLPVKQLASDVRDTCFPLFGFQQQEDDLRPWTIP